MSFANELADYLGGFLEGIEQFIIAFFPGLFFFLAVVTFLSIVGFFITFFVKEIKHGF